MTQMIQSYEVLERIGAGGMAKVMKVRHRISGEIRAMKILYEQFAFDPQYKRRFEEEASTSGRLNHPNIVKVYDYITDGDQLCIIMEYVEGKPLSKVIGREVGPIVHDNALPIFFQIASAIDHAHNLPNPVIHRDIKPANILVTPDRVAKVTDFGIAKVLGEESHTATGTMLGTIEYMSPEQMTGKDVDQRSDVYSLGITLYEMLAGRLPFNFKRTDSILDKIRVITESPMPDPRDYYPHIPDHLVDIVRKATQKEKSKRFNSVAEMIKAIRDEEFVNTQDLEEFGDAPVTNPSYEYRPPVTNGASPTVMEGEEEEEESGGGVMYGFLIVILIGVIIGLIFLISTLLKN